MKPVFLCILLSVAIQHSLAQIRIVGPAGFGFRQPPKNNKPGALSADPPRGSNTLTNEEKNDGWQLLFDGKSLTGWHTFNKTFMDGKWEVNEGTIHLTDRDKTGLATTHDLVTDQAYGDFDFKAEWKVAAQTNSGIMIHVQEGATYSAPHMTGPEMQVLDNV